MNEKAPPNLGVGGTLWKRIVSVYDLRADELQVLEDACRSKQLAHELEKDLRSASKTVSGSTGQTVVNPLVPEIRQQRTATAALLKQLKLPDEQAEVPAAGGSQSDKGRAVAHARWQKSG